jgi:autotransporter-associated beta strand protein
MSRTLCTRCLALVAFAGAASPASAQYFQWSGAVNNIWDTTTPNWSSTPNTWVNSPTSQAFFPQAAFNVTLGSDITLNRLTAFGGGDSTVVATGRRLVLDGTNPNIWVNGGRLSIQSGQIIASGGLRKDGSGTLYLDQNLGYQGPTTVAAGLLQLQYRLPVGNDLAVDSGATLQFIQTTTHEVGALTGAGSIIKFWPTGTTALAVRGSASAPVFSGNIGSTGPLEVHMAGPGTQVFAGSLHECPVVIDGGTLIPASPQALGASVAISAGAAGTLGLQGDYTVTTELTIRGSGAAGRRGAIDNMSGANVIESPIYVDAFTGSATIGATSGSLMIHGQMSSNFCDVYFDPAASASITIGSFANHFHGTGKRGPGTLVLTGSNNTGYFWMEEGPVVVGGPGVEVWCPLTFGTAASEFRVNGNSPQVQGLADGVAGMSTVINGSPSSSAMLNVAVSVGRVVTFNGVVLNGAGSAPLGMNFNWFGTQVFTQPQPYTGPTYLSYGTLITRSLGSSQVYINSGTLRMDGNLNNVTMADGVLESSAGIRSLAMSGGTLRPGGGGPGSVVFQSGGGGLATTGGTIELQIQGSAPGAGFDRLLVNAGDVQLGEGVVTLALPGPQGSFAPTDMLFIVNNAGPGALTGWFAGLPDHGAAGTAVPALANVGGFARWRIYYHANAGTGALTGGNDIALAPASCAADMNGDGQLNVADFLSFLSLYAAADSAADSNGDTQINIADFLTFLAAYAAGC